MHIQDTYFVVFTDGTAAWLGAGIKPEKPVATQELRQMLVPDTDMVLRNKTTGELSSGHWMREDGADNWEEVPSAEIELQEETK